MSETMTARVLPADVYDALEFSALVYGGIGRGRYFSDVGEYRPVCGIGHLINAGVVESSIPDVYMPAHQAATKLLGFGSSDNDAAVCAINRRNGGAHLDARVTFAEWCAELGVVRGES